jgi:chorismate synthase
MQFDLGSTAQVIVAFFALGFGAVAQLIVGDRASRWLWVVAAAGWVVGAVFMSEVLFASATQDEIQPIIDGLAFDEALLGGLVGGVVAAAATWAATRQVPATRPS